jgi:hypothetical protein|tara:strand:- start:38 stop:310 length:273 start_codon:yes stop_codon:yes gene_type:complete
MKFSYTKEQLEASKGPKKIMRSCKTCAHIQVCEAHRTLVRSLKQFDNEFGDMIDVGVIHNEDNSCVDLLAISCKHYISSTAELIETTRLK